MLPVAYATPAAVAFLVVQYTVGLPDISVEDQTQLLNNQTLFVTEALVILIFGAAVAWWSARSVLAFKDGDPRIRSYLSIATGLATWALIFFILRLLFSPTGYFSLWDGGPESPWPGVNLTGLAFADPVGVVTDVILAVIVGAVAWYWARRGNNARLFPVWIGGLTTGLVAAAMSAPIAAGVFGGVTGTGVDALVALYRTLGLGVFQSAFAQGLTSDPLDKTISYTVVYLILASLPITVRTMFSRGEATVAA